MLTVTFPLVSVFWIPGAKSLQPSSAVRIFLSCVNTFSSSLAFRGERNGDYKIKTKLKTPRLSDAS